MLVFGLASYSPAIMSGGLIPSGVAVTGLGSLSISPSSSSSSSASVSFGIPNVYIFFCCFSRLLIILSKSAKIYLSLFEFDIPSFCSDKEG